MSKFLFCGFNGFQQFGEAHALKISALTEFRNEYAEGNSLLTFSWAFNVFALNKELTVRGFVGGKPNNVKKFQLEHKIKKICSNDNICLVLLENCDLFKLNVKEGILFKLNFIDVEQCHKRNIFGELKNECDVIEHIACGITIHVVITKNNIVYNVPSKVHQFPSHEIIKTLVCGFEHAIVLNSNGDVYTWGNGLRGQLGHDNLKFQEFPLLLNALAGVKITAVAAGGWHSAAISAFGDIYVWGSNVDGQLGIEVFKITRIESNNVPCRLKNPTVYPLPQIIELPNCCGGTEEDNSCNLVQVVCGGRHTYIKKSCGKIFCTGWNEYGQLGLGTDIKFKDKFTENPNVQQSPKDILCGVWCTVITF